MDALDNSDTPDRLKLDVVVFRPTHGVWWRPSSPLSRLGSLARPLNPLSPDIRERAYPKGGTRNYMRVSMPAAVFRQRRMPDPRREARASDDQVSVIPRRMLSVSGLSR